LTNNKSASNEPKILLAGAQVNGSGQWTQNSVIFTNSSPSYAYIVARFRWLESRFGFDNFALYEAIEISNTEELQTVINEAQALYDSEAAGASELQAAIEKAQSFLASESPADVLNAIDELKTAMRTYKYVNASPSDPLDVTDFIVNPSFESAFTGWENLGFATQTNADFSIKNGNTYIEKWVNRGSRVPDASIQQTLTGIPNGKYTLKAGTMNIQQSASGGTTNNSAIPQTGVSLFAGHKSVAVDTLKDRSLDFTVLDNQLTLGFKAENATGNWIACDNFRLTYLGFDLSAISDELQELINAAITVSNEKMNSVLHNNLAEAINVANSAGTLEEIAAADKQLRAAMLAASISIKAYDDLQVAIEAALAVYADGGGNEANVLNAALLKAQTLAGNPDATVEEVNAGTEEINNAVLAYRVANGTGTVPVVVTNPQYTRGATEAFGRSTITGVTTSNLLEHGFCWSTQPEPSILDNRTTQTFSNNGYIYRMRNLTPATVYYVRAYAITKTYAIGYGDVIKIITIPKGTVTFQLNSSVTSAAGHHERIKAAMESAVDYFNKLTSIQNHHLSVNYNAGTPTAEASYGGYMQFGASESYQQTGTALHEMGHTIGVGQHSIWYGPNSPLRETGESGNWLGDRANNLVKFLDNDPAGYMRGDKVHMWPYGINGAHEDTGSELLYTGNALIVQALGEDGLPPTGGFATPAYTFLHDDTVKYYIKNEADMLAQGNSFLKEGASGNLAYNAASIEEVLVNDSAAWYLSFNPATQYYQIRNAATGKYFSYQTSGANGVRLTSVATPATAQSFQLMGSRTNIEIGVNENVSSVKGYWIVRPQATLNPPCFVAGTNGATSVATFNFANTATAQRWVIMTGKEAQKAIDPVIASPDNLTGEAQSPTKIRLQWDAVAGARSYRIYRAALPDSVYKLVKDLHNTTTYVDLIGLTPNTIYYYKVYSLNNRGESPDAIPVRVITQKADGSPGDGITSLASITGEETTTVLPNPVKAGELLNIRFDAGISMPERILVEIFDAKGKCVLSQAADKTVYAPGRSGVYIVKITGAAVETFKLIVN
ncbi:MAG: fibronectin type III domain-containing protein, partial [Dysgonamonadaceae bacterium]|nr:fibronectin type III domain-containing protein [Dysgonamonadaceae bacterium]